MLIVLIMKNNTHIFTGIYFADSLALAKPSYQSSTYRLKNVKYTADRANDGNRNVEGFLQPYFAHTKDGPESEPWPWWQVDLEDEYVITGIFILNRRNWGMYQHVYLNHYENMNKMKIYSNNLKRIECHEVCGF